MTKRPYAAGTKVGEEKSFWEIGRLMQRYGAAKFATGYDEQGDHFAFEVGGVPFKFLLPTPSLEAAWENTLAAARRSKSRTPADDAEALERERDRRMRAMVIYIKATLVAVDEGIVSFGEAFVGQVVTDDGRTVAERMAPKIEPKALGARREA